MRSFGIVVALLLLANFAFANGEYPVVPVTYSALSPDTYRVATAQGDVACAASSSGDWIYQNAKMIVMSSEEAIFGGPGDVISGDNYFDKILFDPIGLTNNGGSLNGTFYQAADQSLWKPRVFWRLEGRDCYNWNYLSYNGYDPNTAIGVRAASVPSPNPVSGIFFGEGAGANLPAGKKIFLKEFIGPDAVSGAEAWGNTVVPFFTNTSGSSAYRFKPFDSSTGIVYYTGTGTGWQFGIYEPPFTSERGTRWISIGTSDVSFALAKEIAKPGFTFIYAPSGTAGVGVYSFNTLITDTVDRTPQNRKNGLPDDEYPASLSSPDTGGVVTSPLRAAMENTRAAKNLYMIGAAQFPGFADTTITDPQGYSTAYTEKQGFFAGSTSSAVAYDASSLYRDVVVNKLSAIAYSVKFDGNDYGVPVCTGDLNSTTTDDWTSCTQDSNSRTAMHRMKIMFMGGEWLITDMQAPTSQLASAAAAVNGGSVKLAKETKYGIINAGQSIQSAPFEVRLNNVSATVFQNLDAVFDILDANNSVVGQIQVAPGQTYTFTQSGSGNSIRIYVLSTNVTAHVANVAVFFGGNFTNSTHGVLNVGQQLNAGNLKVRLADVGVFVLSPPYYAVIDVLKNGVVIGQVSISPGQTFTFVDGATGQSIRIHVYHTSPGFTLQAKWAEIGIYSDEITLRDSMRYNLVSSTDVDKDYKVSLLWKNRDYFGASSSAQPDSLREIVIYNVDGLDAKMKKGDSVPMLKSNNAIQLRYEGITPVGSTNTNNTTICPGYTNMSIGQVIGTGSLRARLADVSVAVGPNNLHPAIIDILDQSGTVVGQIQVDPGTQFTFVNTGYGDSITVGVCQTQPGFTLSQKWAMVQVSYGTTPYAPGYHSLAAATYRLASAPGDVACSATASKDTQYTAKMIKVDFDSSLSMRVIGLGMGTFNTQEVYYDPIGKETKTLGASVADAAERSASYASSKQPIMMWKVPGRDCYNWNYAKYGNDMAYIDQAGTDTVGTLRFYGPNGQWMQNANGFVAIRESAQSGGIVAIPMYFGTGSAAHSFRSYLGYGMVTYVIGQQIQQLAVPPLFVSQGGTRVSEVNDYSVSLTIKKVVVANRAPVITGVKGPSTLNAGQTGTWTVSAYDPENGPLSFEVVWGDEPTEKGESAKAMNVSLTHIYYDAGTYAVKFTVSDEQGASAQATATVLVKPSAGNSPPSIATCSLPVNIIANQPATIGCIATDPDGEGDIGSWGVTWGDGNGYAYGCMQGAVCNTFSGTHAWSMPGTYNVTISVGDRHGASDTTTFQVQVVAGTNSPPSIASCTVPTPSILVNQTANFGCTAIDPDGDDLSWGVAWGDGTGGGMMCPPGAGCTSYTQPHAWSAPGNYNVSFEVNDGHGGSDVEAFQIQVVSGKGKEIAPTPAEVSKEKAGKASADSEETDGKLSADG